jgi:hypothetical protein
MAKSGVTSFKSKTTMTASELQKYFKQNEEDIKSKFKTMDKKSLVSNYRTKLMKKLDRSNELADNTTALEKTL